MTSISVDSNLIRYSHIEGTHYFYDPTYPTTIQFLLNGKWEPWDVAWVKSRAQDPEVRRIAEDADARSADEHLSGCPPSAPANTSPIANGYGLSDPSGSAVLPSPSALEANEAPRAASHDYLPHIQPPSQLTSPVSPLSPGCPPSVHAPRTQPYTSPYATEPAPPNPATTQSPAVFGSHSPKPPDAIMSDGVPTASYPPQDPNIKDEPASPFFPPANRDTKILLSLDGDGIRGLSAVLLVESLVNAICSRLGRRVDPFQIFDLMGGVSTTGLLAIMIGRLRMRAHRAREAYVSLSKAIYLDKWQFFVSLDPHVQPQAGATALETSIKELMAKESSYPDELFFDTRPDSTNVFVISTKVEIGSNQPAIIRSYPTRRMAGPELDTSLTIPQAIHAALQAPRYMDPQGAQTRRAVIRPGLVDYGTGKNNPIRDLYYECRKLYSYTNDTMVVVSIGTGAGFDRMQEIHEMANSIDDRQAEAQGIGDKFEGDNRNLIEQGWMKYFRFNVPDLQDVRLDESLEVDKIMAKTHAYLAQPDIGQKFYACVDTIIGVLKGDQGSWPHLG